jgi:hypothetical protein
MQWVVRARRLVLKTHPWVYLPFTDKGHLFNDVSVVAGRRGNHNSEYVLTGRFALIHWYGSPLLQRRWHSRNTVLSLYPRMVFGAVVAMHTPSQGALYRSRQQGIRPNGFLNQ